MKSINANQLANDAYDTLRAIFINSLTYHSLVKLCKTGANASYASYASYASCVYFALDFADAILAIKPYQNCLLISENIKVRNGQL
jgi:putative effector of murein hydrolase